MKPRVGIGLVAVVAGAGCAPELNWREVRPPDGGAVALFPCKPSSDARRVALAGTTVRLVLHACTTRGMTWALAFADVGDPARVGPALQALGSAAAANLAAAPSDGRPLQVAGATPNPWSRTFDLHGKVADGRTLREQLAVFSKGTRVYQATVLGERIDAEAAASFFSSLRVES